MFDFVNPFDFGSGGFNYATSPGPIITGSGTQTTSIPTGTPWWQSLSTLGLDGFKTWLNFDLAQQQVKAGQYPSQNASGNLLGGSVGNYGGLLTFAIVAAAILLLFKLVRGR